MGTPMLPEKFCRVNRWAPAAFMRRLCNSMKRMMNTLMAKNTGMRKRTAKCIWKSITKAPGAMKASTQSMPRMRRKRPNRKNGNLNRTLRLHRILLPITIPHGIILRAAESVVVIAAPANIVESVVETVAVIEEATEAVAGVVGALDAAVAVVVALPWASNKVAGAISRRPNTLHRPVIATIAVDMTTAARAIADPNVGLTVELTGVRQHRSRSTKLTSFCPASLWRSIAAAR